jgi:transcriptional regulator with XRE-family HTH domain
MPESCTAIIDRLIEERHNKGMTQKDLAKAASLTQSVLARLESKKAMPQLDTLLRVAATLGCDIAVVPTTK